MHFWNYGSSAGWPMAVLMIILMLLLTSSLIAAVVVTLRHTANRLTDSAPRILDERFARGEIDEDEYRKRKSALREKA